MITRPEERVASPSNNFYFLRFFLLVLTLALIANIAPVIYGHPVIVSDNLTQNNPLRYLVSQAILKLHLPSWNPFAWAGSPLAAGFNSGAFYPLILFYLIFSPDVAFALFQAVLQAVFGLGLYILFFHLGFERRASRIIAIASPFVGYYAAQSVHLDMVGGLAMLPYMTIAVLRGSRAKSRNAAILNGLLLGVSYSLVVLAGAPEAMIDEAIFIGLFLLLEIVFTRIELSHLAIFAGVALIVIILVPEVQLLPGLSFVTASQRGALPFTYAEAGPFYPTAFLSLITPFLFGGPGGFVQPNYFGPYGFEEITIYIGIVPVAFAIASLIKLFMPNRLDPSRFNDNLTHRRTLIHLVVAATFSTLLALGTFTPLEQIMLYVPVYNRQRLPSRNIFALDYIALILAVPSLTRFLTSQGRDKLLLRTSIVVVAMIVIATTSILIFQGNFVRALDGIASDFKNMTEISISSLVEALIALSLVGLVVFRQKLSSRAASIGIIALLVIDIISFNFQAYYSSAPSTALTMAKTPAASSLVKLMHENGGRFGIYDPLLYYYGELMNIGTPNLNIYNQIQSIGGYSSLSLGNYEQATSSHVQASFDPALLTSQLGKDLELTTVLTGPLYLQHIQPTQDLVSPIPAPIVIAKHTANTSIFTESDFTGAPITASTIAVSFDQVNHTPTGREVVKPIYNLGIASIKALQVRLYGSNTLVSAHFVGTATSKNPSISIFLFGFEHPVTFTQVIAQQQLPTGTINPALAIAAGITIEQPSFNIALDAPLSGYLTPDQYSISREIDSLTAYTRRHISSQITRFKGDTPSPPIAFSQSNIKVNGAKLTLDGKIQYDIFATKRTTVTFSETYAQGWEGTMVNRGATTNLKVSSCGIFICVTIPKGIDHVSFNYVTPKLRDGAILSFFGVLFALAAYLFAKSPSGKSIERMPTKHRSGII